MSDAPRTLGQVGYEANARQHFGHPVGTIRAADWSELPTDFREIWETTAREIVAAAHASAAAEADKLRKAAIELLGTVLTTRAQNTREWMALSLVPAVNATAAALGDSDRVTFEGGQLLIVRQGSTPIEVAINA